MKPSLLALSEDEDALGAALEDVEAKGAWALLDVLAAGVEAPDAVSGIRPWDETIARIDSGWLSLGVSLPPEWKPFETGFKKRVSPGNL